MKPLRETDLHAALCEAGCRDLSSAQLKRLRREGLLQHPTQQHHIGTAGSESSYPPEAVRQLVGVVRIREHRRQRPFDAVRFLTWEEGLWVDHHHLRTTLARLVRASAVVTQRLTGRGDSQDRADVRARKLAESDSGSRFVARFSAQGLDAASVAFATMQIAEGMEDAALATKPLDDTIGFSKFAASLDSEITLFDAIQQHDLPPLSQWPRLISRTGKKHIDIGHAYLTFVQQLATTQLWPSVPGQPRMSDDSDHGIRYRAVIAATGVVMPLRSVRNLIATIETTTNM